MLTAMDDTSWALKPRTSTGISTQRIECAAHAKCQHLVISPTNSSPSPQDSFSDWNMMNQFLSDPCLTKLRDSSQHSTVFQATNFPVHGD